MRIYILRHTERVHDASFFAPLTKNGLIQAENMVENLESIDINKIYCSPFIRIMQTAYPYSKKHFVKLNIDYALSEYKLKRIIPEYAANVTLPLYIAELFNYDSVYISSIKTTDIPYPETKEDLNNRVNKFLNRIIDVNAESNDNILLITHGRLCESFMEITNKYAKIKPDNNSLTDYQQGQLTLIYDTNPTTNHTDSPFIFKKIN